MYVYLIPFLPPLNNPGQNPDIDLYIYSDKHKNDMIDFNMYLEEV